MRYHLSFLLDLRNLLFQVHESVCQGACQVLHSFPLLYQTQGVWSFITEKYSSLKYKQKCSRHFIPFCPLATNVSSLMRIRIRADLGLNIPCWFLHLLHDEIMRAISSSALGTESTNPCVNKWLLIPLLTPSCLYTRLEICFPKPSSLLSKRSIAYSDYKIICFSLHWSLCKFSPPFGPHSGFWISSYFLNKQGSSTTLPTFYFSISSPQSNGIFDHEWVR